MIYIKLLLLLLSVRLLRGHEDTELHLSVFCKQLLPECIIDWARFPIICLDKFQ